MVQWATDHQIHDPVLVREMFSLLFRQYDALGEVSAAMEKAYVIGQCFFFFCGQCCFRFVTPLNRSELLFDLFFRMQNYLARLL